MVKRIFNSIEAPGHVTDSGVRPEFTRLSQLKDEKGDVGIELLESILPNLPLGKPEKADVKSMVALGWAAPQRPQ